MKVQTIKKDYIFNKVNLCLALIFIATGIRSFWGLFFMCPQAIKVIFSGLIYLSLLVFPYNSLRQSISDFNKVGYLILSLLIIFIVVALFRGLIDNGSAIPGNKYISLFFNEYTLLIFFPPIFSFLGSKKEIWYCVKYLYFSYLVFGVLCLSLLKLAPLSMSILLVPIFLPYVTGYKKILIYLNLLVMFIFGLAGSRMSLLLLVIALVAYLVNVSSFFQRFVKFISIVTVSLPLVLITLVISNEVSPFELIQQHTESDKKLLHDDRTFLYSELAIDLTLTQTWLMGKGPIGSYYSTLMDDTTKSGGEADNSNRIQNEVFLLSYILKGGLVYAVCYLILMIIAIFNAAFRGKNKLVRSMSVILSGVFVNSFMGDMTGCSLFQIVIWLIIGTCFSSKWINYTDSEIIERLKFK